MQNDILSMTPWQCRTKIFVMIFQADNYLFVDNYILAVYANHAILTVVICPDSFCFLKSKINHKTAKEKQWFLYDYVFL